MRIFLSYASEQRDVAKRICAALSAHSHDVFIDVDGLPRGEEFHARIAEEVERSDLFIFLLSPQSIEQGTYALSELQVAKKKWRNPSGKVIPVQIIPTDPTRVDPYLSEGVTILRPEGSVSAEVVNLVRVLAGAGQPVTDSVLADELLLRRVDAYQALWKCTNVLPKWPRATHVEYRMLGKFSKRLRRWYFHNGGGLFLSRSAHGCYSALQDALTALLAENRSGVLEESHYDAIRELCSTLRTQLARDLGTRC